MSATPAAGIERLIITVALRVLLMACTITRVVIFLIHQLRTYVAGTDARTRPALALARFYLTTSLFTECWRHDEHEKAPLALTAELW